MNELNLIVETTEEVRTVTAELIELTVEQLGEVGGGVAYVLI
jgi:hypothetical protein